MAIARASPGAKLLTSSFASLGRLYSTTVSVPRPPSKSYIPPTKGTSKKPFAGRPQQSQDGAKKPKPLPMYIPSDAKKFIHKGTLKTTPDTWAFLNETGIEYDNSKTRPLHLGPDHARIKTDFTTRVYFSPRHIMHPYHLTYLQPREHPLTEKMKSDYRAKTKEEPLWMIIMSQNSQPGLVRSIGHRRLKAAFWTAMEEMGYKRLPKEGEPQIKGTIMILISDTLKAANHPANRFGQALAQSVVREWKAMQQRREDRKLETKTTTKKSAE